MSLEKKIIGTVSILKLLISIIASILEFIFKFRFDLKSEKNQGNCGLYMKNCPLKYNLLCRFVFIRNEDVKVLPIPDHKLIVSVPCTLHSHKPPLAGMFL